MLYPVELWAQVSILLRKEYNYHFIEMKEKSCCWRIRIQGVAEEGFPECGGLPPRCFAPGGCYHPPRPDSFLSRMIASSTSRGSAKARRLREFPRLGRFDFAHHP
jgi:hypothetical protein